MRCTAPGDTPMPRLTSCSTCSGTQEYCESQGAPRASWTPSRLGCRSGSRRQSRGRNTSALGWHHDAVSASRLRSASTLRLFISRSAPPASPADPGVRGPHPAFATLHRRFAVEAPAQLYTEDIYFAPCWRRLPAVEPPNHASAWLAQSGVTRQSRIRNSTPAGEFSITNVIHRSESATTAHQRSPRLQSQFQREVRVALELGPGFPLRRSRTSADGALGPIPDKRCADCSQRLASEGLASCA
jgi:hypothetical protein